MTGSGSLGAPNRIQPRGSPFDELTTGSSFTIRCRTRGSGDASPPLLRTSTPRGFQHQVAVVTGGGRGIGRAITRTFAEAGASVAVFGRTEPKRDGYRIR